MLKTFLKNAKSRTLSVRAVPMWLHIQTPWQRVLETRNPRKSGRRKSNGFKPVYHGGSPESGLTAVNNPSGVGKAWVIFESRYTRFCTVLRKFEIRANFNDNGFKNIARHWQYSTFPGTRNRSSNNRQRLPTSAINFMECSATGSLSHCDRTALV